MKQKHTIFFQLSFLLIALSVGAVLHVPPTQPPAIPPDSEKITHAPQLKTPTKKETKVVQAAATVAKSAPPAPIAPTSPKHEAIKNSVQHEYVYRMFATPNDPGYGGDWTLAKTNAPAAWDVSTGNNQTIIAIIDGGVALAHEDLADRWYSNSNESGMTAPSDHCWSGTPADKQTNGCDDDNNGYVDDWRGWNFALGDNNPQTGRQNSAGSGTRHGTQVAGLAGASGNNGLGVASINWQTKLMPLQALDDDGIGYTSDVAAAIYYAVDNGAEVINMSLGTYADDPVVKAAINYATNHQVVTVAAAGNCGDGSGEECAGVPVGAVAYPAAYPSVIAVGASTQSDQRASFSSYGASVDVVAPGYGVPSSTSWSAASPSSLYSGALYGTSYSSPQVASLVSLIKSIRPGSSVADITAIIGGTATKPSAMNGLVYTQQFGHGIINAGTALSITQNLNAATSTPILLQAGSYIAEHIAPANVTVGSGCIVPSGEACTVQLLNTNTGYSRYLPYIIASSQGAGWSWSSETLEGGEWEIRTRSGNYISNTPYLLLKK